MCCDSWGYKESDTTEPLNWTEQREYRILSTGLPGRSPHFFFFVCLCFSFIFLTGVWSSQTCGYEQSLVLLHISVHLSKVYKCSWLHNGSVSVELITWKHIHILTDTVLTCVLICNDLHMRTPRNIGTPVLLCLTDNAFLKTNCTFMATLCQASILAQFFLQHLLTSCLCVTFL